MSDIGISGLAAYVPPHRVQLEDWCDWTGNSWDKIRNVVGESFRVIGPNESVYTMAATAVLRLIRQYDIDPNDIGFLGLGTESSTDNSAGPIIIKGMLDDILVRDGKNRIARSCEVPEFKHACLGGVYAMKGALRYLASDGRGKKAIVVCADIAEYARGSSGEPTQGAGAVAMLIESDPKLVRVDLNESGSASDYRALDFRKPMVRFCSQKFRHDTRVQDFPVFNGRYSTTCYIDETLHALQDMYEKRDLAGGDYLQSLKYVFMHRPYRRMPETGMAIAYLSALCNGDDKQREEFKRYAKAAGVDADQAHLELTRDRNIRDYANPDNVGLEAYPLVMAILHLFRKEPAYEQEILQKLSLGSESNCNLGNLYTAALPAWLAAGFEVALESDCNLNDEELLTMGYGSGDAAEVIPFHVMDTWREAAAAIRFDEAMQHGTDLTQQQYEALHDRLPVQGLSMPADDAFLVDRVGQTDERHFSDIGIEYHTFKAAGRN